MYLLLCGFICPVLLLGLPSVVIYQENFEMVIEQTTNYQSSYTFRANTQNYWTRTDGSDINTLYEYNNFDGDYFWAGEDLDDGAGDQLDIKTITTDFITVKKNEPLKIGASFAVGNPAAFDKNDYLKLNYSEDNIIFQTLIDFRNPDGDFNQNLLLDTDQDGYGDGQALSNSFRSFYTLITPQSDQIWLQIEAHADSENEEVAFDNLVVSTTAIPESSRTSIFIALLVFLVVLCSVKMSK